MLSVINKETKKQEWITVVTGSDINSDDCFSGEGLGMNDRCSITYKFKNTGYKRELLNVNGKVLIRRSNRVLNSCFSNKKPDGEYPDIMDVKQVTQEFTQLYGTGLIDPVLFRKMKNECNPEHWNIVNKSLKKRKSVENQMVMDFICCYLHWKIRQNSKLYISSDDKEELRTSNHLEVIDYLHKDVDENWILGMKDSWKNQPIVERMKIKTFKEYTDLYKVGFLTFKWI